MNKFSFIKTKVVNNISELVVEWKNQNQTIVFTNGCFDILHRGHIQYLAEAADFGDKLIVGINSDNSVKQLDKGASRPIQDENSRALIIAAIEFVDAVVIFNETTPLQLITKIKPNVLIKGGDYDSSITDRSDKKYIVGSDVVKNSGGLVQVIKFVEGFSTSKIEEKIKNS